MAAMRVTVSAAAVIIVAIRNIDAGQAWKIFFIYAIRYFRGTLFLAAKWVIRYPLWVMDYTLFIKAFRNPSARKQLLRL